MQKFVIVDAPHEHRPLTVQAVHRRRRWWTRELPALALRTGHVSFTVPGVRIRAPRRRCPTLARILLEAAS